MRNSMYRNKSFKLLTLGVACFGAVLLSGCSSADVPDLYNYDDLTKYIDLGKYKGVEYEASDTSVTSSEVMAYIYEQLANSATVQQVDKGTVGTDSVAVIDYEGRLNGEVVDGAVAEGVAVDMADNNYVDGFAEGLLGHKVGDEFDMNVTFPQDYTPELAGKTVVFHIVINSLQQEVIPEYTDQYVKKNTEYGSKKAYEKAVREELEKGKKEDAESSEKLEIFNAILEDSKVKKYPDKEFKLRYESVVDTYKSLAEDNDKEFDDYLKDEMGITEKEFEALAKKSAELAVKQELILHQIAKLEGINISKKDYNDYLEELLENAGYTRSSYKKDNGISIEEYADRNNLYTSLLYNKVMDRVIEISVSK
ncbi:MAG: FKBP-type peptidyl-prolyl cis-trans isomerase [Clostridiales bacterium]|nr:FKBP-type peptidyl-prolyl cis-trans isomerase [Candidatus Crickella merdequi]